MTKIQFPKGLILQRKDNGTAIEYSGNIPARFEFSGKAELYCPHPVLLHSSDIRCETAIIYCAANGKGLVSEIKHIHRKFSIDEELSDDVQVINALKRKAIANADGGIDILVAKTLRTSVEEFMQFARNYVSLCRQQAGIPEPEKAPPKTYDQRVEYLFLKK